LVNPDRMPKDPREFRSTVALGPCVICGSGRRHVGLMAVGENVLGVVDGRGIGWVTLLPAIAAV
jgi:hypothetical protein